MKALAIVMLLAAAAHADDRQAAERYFRAGARAYAAQSFAAAASDFEEAYRAMPLPEIAFSAAQAYRKLYRVEPRPEHVRRAVELYRAYLDRVRTGGRVGDAADNLAELQRELDKLKAAGVNVTAAAPSPERTRVGVSVTVADQAADPALREVGDGSTAQLPGLAATLDGARLEPFALVDAAPGEHVLAVSAEGYAPVEKRLVAVAGQAQLVEVELKARPARITVATEAGAAISVDGRAAASPIDLAAGRHLLAIVHRGREPYARELLVTRGESLRIDAPLAPTARRRAVPWIFAGAGVLAAGAATTGVLALVHDGRASDLRASLDRGDRPPSDADAYDREVRARDRWATATWIAGGAALAAAGVGLALYVFDTPSAERVRVAPAIGGFTASGAF